MHFYATVLKNTAGFDAVDAGANTKCSLLFIAGESDDLVPAENVQKLRQTIEAENTAMKACEMIIVKGAGHAFAHRPESQDDKGDSDRLLHCAANWLVTELTH